MMQTLSAPDSTYLDQREESFAAYVRQITAQANADLQTLLIKPMRNLKLRINGDPYSKRHADFEDLGQNTLVAHVKARGGFLSLLHPWHAAADIICVDSHSHDSFLTYICGTAAGDAPIPCGATIEPMNVRRGMSNHTSIEKTAHEVARKIQSLRSAAFLFG